MTLLLLESLGALVLLVLIVWWTMFSGRKKGELPGQHDAAEAEQPAPPQPAIALKAADEDEQASGR